MKSQILLGVKLLRASVFIFLIPGSHLNAESIQHSNGSNTNKTITEKQANEINRYKKRSDLLTPLLQAAQGKNLFDVNTIYVMKNFDIVQKVSDGYLILPRTIPWPSGSTMQFDAAFLKTNKQLTSDLIISGVLVYSGLHKMKGINGFDQMVPSFEILAGLSLLGVKKGGDPFNEIEY